MLIVALISTVVLLVWMGFFLMSSLPLLILEHDTPVDARVVRGLFNIYYTAILATGAVGAAGSVFAGRLPIAVALGAIAAIGFAGRRWLIGAMDAIRSRMTPEDRPAIREFRRLHVAGMLGNALLLVVVCAGLTQVSL